MAGASSEHFSNLVRKVAETRDRSAFAELFDHFAPRLKAYLVRLGSDPAQAEELAQEVMITLWRKAALFDASRASAATWLFRIARNRRIDSLRRDKSGALEYTELNKILRTSRARKEAAGKAKGGSKGGKR